MSNAEIKEYEYEKFAALEIDNVANENPMMNKEAFKLLMEDIKNNGQQEPVLICDGKVIDGRNRLKACKELKCKLKVIEFTGSKEEAIKKARSNNDMRRHLSKSQYAMMAATSVMDSRIEKNGTRVSKDKWKKIEDAKEVKEGKVSVRLVENAIRIIKDKDIINKINEVKIGTITIADAITEINKEKEKKKEGGNNKSNKTVDEYCTELKAISENAVDDYNKIIKDRKQTKAALASEVIQLRIKLAQLESK